MPLRRLESPGFVDLQVNGFAGVDFNDRHLDPEAIDRALEAMGRTGVTRCLPTLVTSSFEGFAACARRIARHRHPAITGIHMEGPYISREDGPRGAHPSAHVIAASIEDFDRRQDAAEGRIRLLTIAPESPGAVGLIEHAVERGVRVAIGHTMAMSAEIRDAVRAGATLSTHLGNGCAPVMARHPNVLWDQLGADELLASFIVDGHHLPAATVKSMIRAKTPERTILVTDAVAPAGCPPGTYFIGETKVELSPSGRVSRPGETLLAGAALTMDRAIGNTAAFTGLPIARILPMATTVPATYLGIEPAGRLSVEWDDESLTLRVTGILDDGAAEGPSPAPYA